MGQRDLRQLLVLGATSVIRHARRRKDIADPWLRRMLAAKAAQAGRGSTCEQDGAYHLGADGEGGKLPRAEGARRGRWIGPGPGRASRNTGPRARVAYGPNRVQAGQRTQ